MEVYIEYALAENFILDATLLYLALKTVRLQLLKRRIFLASVLGAAFAVLFPFFNLNGGWAFAVRYAFGSLLCLIAARVKNVKEYILTVLFFYLYTFALGGLLLGMYTFFNLQYTFDGGYFISQTPMGIVLIAAVFFTVVSLKIFSALYKRYGVKKLLYRCEIMRNDSVAEGTGLLDTGNSLTFKGAPVCLLDKTLALQLFGNLIYECTDMKTLYVHTATGGGELKIFPARLKIYSENKENIIDNVYFALSPAVLGKGYQIILHPQLFKEGSHAKRTSATDTKSMEKNLTR